MAIQQLLNLSSSLSIDRRKIVGVQFTRSEIARTEYTPTKNPWRFTIEVPGQPWYQMRSILEGVAQLDRYQPEVIQFNNNPLLEFFWRYQGDVAFMGAPTVLSFTGDQLVYTGMPVLPVGQAYFRSGDIIQVGTQPHPYSVVGDVISTGSTTVTITTHRPNISSTSVIGATMTYGSACQFNMFMTDIPTYKLVPGARQLTAAGGIYNNAIVQFDGPITLVEWTYGV